VLYREILSVLDPLHNLLVRRGELNLQATHTMENLSHAGLWLGALVGAGALYATAVVIYRIFFHPLAKYPGPLLAKVTDAYQLYHAYMGNRHLEFYRMHEKYGKIWPRSQPPLVW
jgi:hypothetical protein